MHDDAGDDAGALALTEDPRAPEADRQRVLEGLREHTEGRHGPSDLEPLALFLRDGSGRVVGGLLGRTWWRWLHVEKLWVDAELRGRGAGARLLDAAEARARARGCVGAQLDTVDPAAYVFYTRRGYETFGVLEGFPPGARQWYLRKSLGDAGAR